MPKTVVLAAMVVLSALAGLTISEFYLRATLRYATYTERNGIPSDRKSYETDQPLEPWLWIHPRNGTIIDEKKDFTETWNLNAEGLVGDLPTQTKKKKEFRILVLGDSYTMGVGDAQSGGYPAALQRIVDEKGRPRPRVRILNGGVAGSDPVFLFHLLSRRLLKYQPDLVVLGINATDLADIERRGGMDRFTEEGWLKPRQVPWWAWAFEQSHLLRAILIEVFGYNMDLRSPVENRRATIKGIQDMLDCLAAFQHLAKENGFQFLPVIHPIWVELPQGRLNWDVLELMQEMKKVSIDFTDLSPYMLGRIPRTGPQSIEDGWFWKHDLHFTNKGYQLLGEALAQELQHRKWIP